MLVARVFKTMTCQEGLDLAKVACTRVDAALQGGRKLDLSDLRDTLGKLTKTLLTIQINQVFAEKAAAIQLDQLRLEVHNELVDREANAARVADRQRFLFERATALAGQASSAERALTSASYVEAALVTLCPHAKKPTTGTTQIANACTLLY